MLSDNNIVVTRYSYYVGLYEIDGDVVKKMDEVKEKFGTYGVKIIQEEVKTGKELINFFYEQNCQNSEDYLKDELTIDNLINVLGTLKKEDFIDFFWYLKTEDKNEIYELLEEFIFEEHKKYLSENITEFIEEVKSVFDEFVADIFAYDYSYYSFSLEMMMDIISNQDSCFVVLDKSFVDFSSIYYLIDQILPKIGIEPTVLQEVIDY